jgi:hypothetical protein
MRFLLRCAEPLRMHSLQLGAYNNRGSRILLRAILEATEAMLSCFSAQTTSAERSPRILSAFGNRKDEQTTKR